MPTAPIGNIRASATGHDLLLQETNDRCSNDLQLVVSPGSKAGAQSTRRSLEPSTMRRLIGQGAHLSAKRGVDRRADLCPVNAIRLVTRDGIRAPVSIGPFPCAMCFAVDQT